MLHHFFNTVKSRLRLATESARVSLFNLNHDDKKRLMNIFRLVIMRDDVYYLKTP